MELSLESDVRFFCGKSQKRMIWGYPHIWKSPYEQKLGAFQKPKGPLQAATDGALHLQGAGAGYPAHPAYPAALERCVFSF